MFGGYQETLRESVVTSVSDGQSGGEAAEQKGWKGRELVKISGLHRHNKAIDKLWCDKHAATVQQAGDNSSTLGQLAMRKENSYTCHSLEARAHKQLLFVVILYTLHLLMQLP